MPAPFLLYGCGLLLLFLRKRQESPEADYPLYHPPDDPWPPCP